MKICNGSDHPEESLLRGAFSLEKFEESGSSWPHHKTEESEPNECGRIPARRISLEKTRNVGAIAASHVNSQSPRTQDALSLKKHMESGRVSATHVLVEKRYGIRGRLVACHMNLQSH